MPDDIGGKLDRFHPEGSYGDQVERVVTWKTGADLESLAGTVNDTTTTVEDMASFIASVAQNAEQLGEAAGKAHGVWSVTKAFTTLCLGLLIDDGKVRPIIDRTYPLSETDQAMEYIAGGHASGKTVITVA